MKITRLAVTNFRGIAELEHDVPSNGLIATGGNARGKTSLLKAVRAALAAQDIGEDAIRHGADRAEILVDLDALRVKRTITRSGSTLDVRDANGFKAPKPTAYLAEILGTSPLDPLDLLLAKPKDRRAKVLEALPIRVSTEALKMWVPDFTGTVDPTMHGLEVIAKVRGYYYELRKDANKAADDAERAAVQAKLTADAKANGLPAGTADVDGAVAAEDRARAELVRLETLDTAAKQASQRMKGTRERVEGLRSKAAEKRTLADAAPEGLDELRRDVESVATMVEQLERDLTSARTKLVDARAALASREAEKSAADRAAIEAVDLHRQADELAAAMADAGADLLDPTRITTARELVAKAANATGVARAVRDARDHEAGAAAAAERRDQRKAEAERLDKIVKVLSDQAPADLLKSADAIPGLGIDGDDITLDGTRLEALSGAEQMRFCIAVAKRLNAKTRILVVDGLERIDDDQRDAFIHEATRDGWQLLASRVSKGDIVLEAIDAEEAPPAESGVTLAAEAQPDSAKSG